MACNCGKNKKVTVYEYTAPGGAKTTYNTEVQARARQIQKGGSYKPISK